MPYQSGIKWIGEIPNDWEIKRIKHIATLNGRIGWQGLTSEEYCDDGAYLITGVDFSNGGIDWNSCVHVSFDRWREAKEIQIQNGDLLITKDGTVGKVAIVEGLNQECSLNSGVLRILTKEKYNRHFLYYVLLSDVFLEWFTDRNAGNSTIIHLYQNDFNNFAYAVPPLKEQFLIAKHLDSECENIDRIIKETEKQIEILKQYKKSLITETVTKGLDRNAETKECGIIWIGSIPKHWEVKKIKYVANVYTGNSISDDEKELYLDEENARPYISSKDVSADCNCIDYENGMYIKFNDTTFKVAKKGSSVICIEGGSAGKKIGFLDRDVCFVNKLCCLESFSKVEPKFLNYYIQTQSFQEEFFSHIAGLIGGVSQSILKNFAFILPPLAVQRIIVDVLDKKCKEIETVVTDKLAILDNLNKYKKSFIYEFVTGKKRINKVGNA